MPVIAFWGNSDKETGQTTASVAVATLMSIDHNYKTLLVSTGFKDTTIHDSFIQEKNNDVQKMIGVSIPNANVSVESGIEGISRVVTSNRLRAGIIPDYANVVFKGRFDVLTSPKTTDAKDYIEIAKGYPQIIQTATQDYNYIFVDIDKRMPAEIQKDILLLSDVIVVTCSQNIKSIDKYNELKTANELFLGINVLLLLGRYDQFSKYSQKNVTRYLKERNPISSIPYNTLFYEATAEGKVADYFIKYRNLSDKIDRNAVFIEQTKKTCDNIINKLQEIEMRR